MELTEQSVRALVEQVLQNLDGRLPRESQAAGAQAGVFPDVDRAVAAARRGHEELMAATLKVRRAVVAAMRATVLENLDGLARAAVAETGLGRVEDKITKGRIAAEMTPGVEDLETVSFSDDHGLTVVERAPYGVIGSITPSTNPTETIINNGIGMVAGGNAVVFNPHPSAKGVSRRTVDLLNRAIQAAGGPANVLCTVSDPTIESAQELFTHPGINLLVVTGGPGVVKAAMRSGKKVIAAGPGNPPVVVDETAEIGRAAADIVAGASLDNNIICIDEKEVLAVASIADALKGEMKRHGAWELSAEQVDRVTRAVIAEPGAPGHEGAPNKQFVGKDAAVIARAIGLEVPRETRLLLCEVSRDHPLVWTEQLMPVLPLVRVASADEAIDLAVSCEHGFRHTAVMHSRNIDKLSRMARVMNCSLFVKNGPAYKGLGGGGAGFTSWTIASPTGEGLTRARTFTRERRCALIDAFRFV
jgi:acyl-CoA reductase-like NAD-dependent aldehyde dehydrogenase